MTGFAGAGLGSRESGVGMPDLSDQALRDFAAGLRDELAPEVFDSEDYQERLAEIWAHDTYDIDVSREIVRAVKADWFVAAALSKTFGAFERMAYAFGAYLGGSTERERKSMYE